MFTSLLPHRLVARLRAELKKPSGEARISRDDLVALVGHVERAARLARYVRHDPDCALLAVREGAWRSRCTCGLRDAHEQDPTAPR